MIDAADRLASFCLLTGIAPSEAQQLTMTEVEAFASLAVEMRRHRE